MVKTRSDLKGVRVSFKAPRKMPVTSNNSPAGRSSKKYKGANSYCPREVPAWQKEITNFFSPKGSGENTSSGSSNNTVASSSCKTP
ncbi:hypothetical protein RUM44_007553 [Polyplax serrata]|uniref:PCNA-associated factor histone-like domain-containing protein n=1 Tax=Polyplax serrata TaxID=468196 RepID=A0ABR1B9W4_POLSC